MAEVMISSSALILAVCLLRFVLRGRVSPGYLYGLWGLVGLRLMVPWLYPLRGLCGRLQSRFSVMNAVSAVQERILTGGRMKPFTEHVLTGTVYSFDKAAAPVSMAQDAIQNAAQNAIQNAAQNAAQNTVQNAIQKTIQKAMQNAAGMDWKFLIAVVWILGSVILAGWMAAVTIRFAGNLVRNRSIYRGTMPDFVTKPVYVAEGLLSPCYFGWGPGAAIYLPKLMEDEEEKVNHALAHEMGHARHGDWIWGLLRCVLLCCYWINPLVWIAAVFSRRDCELACDEAAVKLLGEKERYAYGRTLVGLAKERGVDKDLFFAAVSMGSGKRAIRERIQVLVKHPGRTGAMAAVLAVLAAVLAACTFTGKPEKADGLVLSEECQYGTLYTLTLKRSSLEAEAQAPILTDPALEVDITCYEDDAGTTPMGSGYPQYGYTHGLTEDGIMVEFLNAQHAASYRIVAESGRGRLEYLFVTHDPVPFDTPEFQWLPIFAKNDRKMIVYHAEVYPELVHLQLVGESEEAAEQFQIENAVSLKLRGAEGSRYVEPRQEWREGSTLDLIYCLEESIGSADELEAIVTGSGNGWDGYTINRLDYQKVRTTAGNFAEAYLKGDLEEAEQYLYDPEGKLGKKIEEELGKNPLDSSWICAETKLHISDEPPGSAEAECTFQTNDDGDGTWKLNLRIHRVYDGWKIEQLEWILEKPQDFQVRFWDKNNPASVSAIPRIVYRVGISWRISAEKTAVTTGTE